MTRTSRRHELVAFSALSLALSWPAVLVWQLRSGAGSPSSAEVREAYGQVAMFYAFGPMLAAMIVAVVYHGLGGLRELAGRVARWRVAPWWYALALVLPIVSQWLGIALWGAFTGTTLTLPTVSAWFTRWIQISVIGGLFSVGEEVGWRGFMLPRVQATHRWLSASLIVGAPWAIWHYPLWFVANRALTGSMPKILAIIVLASIGTLAMSVIITWLVNQSRGSVLIAMLAHGSINANMNIFYEQAGAAAMTSLTLVVCTTAAAVCVALALAAGTAPHPRPNRS